MFVGYLFLQFRDDREIRQINPSQIIILMNLQYYCYLISTAKRMYEIDSTFYYTSQ